MNHAHRKDVGNNSRRPANRLGSPDAGGIVYDSLTVLVYDYCLTFDREIRLVWKYNWGIGSILFLLTRYPTFVDIPLAMWRMSTVQLNPGKCLTIYKILSWFTCFGIATSEGILFLRTYAFYYGNKKFLTFLVSFYLTVLVAAIIIFHLFTRSLRYGEIPPGLGRIDGCHAISGSHIISITYFLIIFEQTVILSLTLYKVIKLARLSSSRLLHALYRDGVFYYVYILLISIGNIIVENAGPGVFVELLSQFQRVTHSILAARVLLHVREAMQKDLRITTGTNMVFAHSDNDMGTGTGTGI